MPEQRLLIVDDDSNLRLLYRRELESAGYEVAAVGSALEALTAVGESTFDLILLDIEMPGMNGLEALQHLRQMAPKTKVIINSAYNIYKANFETWLADDFVVKNSDLKPLKDTIRKVLDLK